MVRKPAYKSNDCPPELRVIDSISGKWTVLVVYLLSEKTIRYGQIQRLVLGISQKVLTQTLRHLERDGIVKRKVYPVVPPQVEYSLTPLGKTVVDHLSGLCLWAKEHYPEVKQARIQYDNRLKK